MAPKIQEYGIVLSGGGARGIAHIGVLAALEKHGIIPGIVSGSSMGAVVGALYSAGVCTDEMLEIARNRKIRSLFEWTFHFHGGMLSLKILMEVLEKHIPEDSFESLKKQLFITASNISTGREVVFSEGPLFRAVLASSSIPIVFEPQVIDGQTYIDGGLFSDLPVEPLVGKCQKIIASHVNYNGPGTELSSMRAIAERVYRLAIYQNVQKSFSKCDYIIEPPELREHSIFDFKHIDKLYEIGYEAAEELIRRIKEKVSDKPVILRSIKTIKEKII
jgi:NTE family protein